MPSTIPRMLFGMTLGIGLSVAAILLEGGKLNSFFQLGMLLVVAGVTAGYLLMSSPLNVTGELIGIALGRRTSTDTVLLRHGVALFADLGKASIAAGMIGLVIGLIHVMENLDKPALIGVGIAASFTALLYGFLGRQFVAQPLSDSLSEHLARAGGGATTGSTGHVTTTVTTTTVTTTSEPQQPRNAA